MRRHNTGNNLTGLGSSLWDGASLSTPILIIISILLMFLSVFKPQVFDSTRVKIVDLFSPVLFVVSLPFQQIAIFLHDVNGVAQLQADNLRLTEENAKLRNWYQIALLLDSENKSLRELLNLDIDPSYENISARVISDVGNTYVKSVIVSAGSSDGVKKGAAVLSGDGLIGRVIEVGNKTSRILLVTDINSRVPVVVEDTGHHAIMSGTNNIRPRLIHIPQDTEISKNVRLITSGYGGLYPYGLPVGRVVINDKKIQEVDLFSNSNRLQIVRIVKKLENKDEDISIHNELSGG